MKILITVPDDSSDDHRIIAQIDGVVKPSDSQTRGLIQLIEAARGARDELFNVDIPLSGNRRQRRAKA